MSVLLVEPRDGLHISKDLPKLGYRGVEACGLVFERMRVPASAVLGGCHGGYATDRAQPHHVSERIR
ncbi:hypothetical protein [Nonomuraea sp. NBC_00507]|uniref:hypothetical protein n=1 Tax=Nonomuraea sp. NBC_00507 TaxID=2976002 RepID=UPI003FA52E55